MPTAATESVAKKYLSVAEAAAVTGLSEGTVGNAVRRGQLKAYKPTPRRVLIPVEELESFIRSRAAAPEPATVA